MDLFQSYEFGRALHVGLDCCWLGAANRAVRDLREEIENLHLKEFAYLVRFRLAQEGQTLLNYLEWFFGECLVDAIAKAVDSAAGGDEQVKALNGPAADRIEGAFDGPTNGLPNSITRSGSKIRALANRRTSGWVTCTSWAKGGIAPSPR